MTPTSAIHDPGDTAPGKRLRRSGLVTGALGLMGFALACAPETSPQHPGPGPVVPDGVSGTLALAADGTLRFRPCDTAEGAVVSDGTGEDLARIVEELGHGSGLVAAHLVLEPPRVGELQVAAPEVASCRDVLSDADFEARGNEPFWNVRITGSEAVFRSPEAPEGVAYGEGRWQVIEDGWRFDARHTGAAQKSALAVQVHPGRCLDGMSGARYPFRAVLQRDGLRAEGCALEGRGQERTGP
jgi:uncharacterized membrane protein